MPGRIKVLIVDDHPLFRQGLRQVVEADARFELVGEAGDGKSALQLILEKKPDIAVLDVNLPGLSGLEVASRLQAKRLPTQIVILTMYKEEETLNRAVDFGVWKPTGPTSAPSSNYAAATVCFSLLWKIAIRSKSRFAAYFLIVIVLFILIIL